jgi:hypothetical protein
MKILIKGGGSAGWLSACYLSLFNEVKIEVPKNSKTIGVGESTIPGFLMFLEQMGITENEVITKCDGIVKSNIQHNNWHNTNWFHPFTGNVKRAYHLNALKLPDLLEEKCSSRLSNFTEEPDIIINCTGFRKNISSDKIVYHNLRNNRAMFGPGITEYLTYSRTYAMDYGWMWNVNLSSRSGNGYVFDSDLITDDKAVEEFLKKSPGKMKEKDIMFLEYRNFYLKEPWEDNEVFVGLSSGFIEPLEATGLYNICWELEHFERCKNKKKGSQIFNRAWQRYVAHIHDFLELFFLTSKNNHTEYWKTFEKVSVIPKYKFDYIFTDFSYNLLSKVSGIPYDSRTNTIDR